MATPNQVVTKIMSEIGPKAQAAVQQALRTRQDVDVVDITLQRPAFYAVQDWKNREVIQRVKSEIQDIINRALGSHIQRDELDYEYGADWYDDTAEIYAGISWKPTKEEYEATWERNRQMAKAAETKDADYLAWQKENGLDTPTEMQQAGEYLEQRGWSVDSSGGFLDVLRHKSNGEALSMTDLKKMLSKFNVARIETSGFKPQRFMVYFKSIKDDQTIKAIEAAQKAAETKAQDGLTREEMMKLRDQIEAAGNGYVGTDGPYGIAEEGWKVDVFHPDGMSVAKTQRLMPSWAAGRVRVYQSHHGRNRVTIETDPVPAKSVKPHKSEDRMSKVKQALDRGGYDYRQSMANENELVLSSSGNADLSYSEVSGLLRGIPGVSVENRPHLGGEGLALIVTVKSTKSGKKTESKAPKLNSQTVYNAISNSANVMHWLDNFLTFAIPDEIHVVFQNPGADEDEWMGSQRLMEQAAGTLINNAAQRATDPKLKFGGFDVLSISTKPDSAYVSVKLKGAGRVEPLRWDRAQSLRVQGMTPDRRKVVFGSGKSGKANTVFQQAQREQNERNRAANAGYSTPQGDATYEVVTGVADGLRKAGYQSVVQSPQEWNVRIVLKENQLPATQALYGQIERLIKGFPVVQKHRANIGVDRFGGGDEFNREAVVTVSVPYKPQKSASTKADEMPIEEVRRKLLGAGLRSIVSLSKFDNTLQITTNSETAPSSAQIVAALGGSLPANVQIGSKRKLDAGPEVLDVMVKPTRFGKSVSAADIREALDDHGFFFTEKSSRKSTVFMVDSEDVPIVLQALPMVDNVAVKAHGAKVRVTVKAAETKTQERRDLLLRDITQRLESAGFDVRQTDQRTLIITQDARYGSGNQMPLGVDDVSRHIPYSHSLNGTYSVIYKPLDRGKVQVRLVADGESL